MRVVCAAMTTALLSTAAMAQQSDVYHACAGEKDPTARLACFDRVDSARHPTASAPAASRPADPDVGLDARQARRERAQRGTPEPAQPAAIVATVVRVIERGPLISAFELSNGQIWEQSESMKFSAEPRQTVTIHPGLLGAFFLKNTAGVSVRVHRLQ